MSSVAYGWCIVGIPLANLLIGGGGICSCLPVTNSHATHQLKAARVAQIAEFVASGSVVCALSAHCDSGFLLTVDLGCYKDFRGPGSIRAPVS